MLIQRLHQGVRVNTVPSVRLNSSRIELPSFEGRKVFSTRPTQEEVDAIKVSEQQSLQKMLQALEKSLTSGYFEFNEAWPDRVRLSTANIDSLNRLSKDTTLPDTSRKVIETLFDRHLSRILSQFRGGRIKMDADDVQGLWHFDRKLQTLEQRAATGQIISEYINARWNTDNWSFKKPNEATLDGLRALAKPYGRAHVVDRLASLSPFQVTNGVVHTLLNERKGPPLKEITIASYNLEHFQVERFRNYQSDRPDGFQSQDDDGNRLPPPVPRKPLPLKVLEQLVTENLEKQLSTIMNSLRKVFRLGEVIKKKPENDPLPDVIAFQEVKSVTQLRSFLIMNGLFDKYPNIMFYPADRGADGLAIVASDAVRAHHPNRVAASRTPRPSGEITLDLGGGNELTLFNTHFKADNWENGRMSVYQERQRLQEAASIGNRVEQLGQSFPNQRFVVLGDFNTDHRSNMKAFKKALKLQEVPLQPGRFTHKNGHLDRIFISPNLKSQGVEVIGELNSNPPPPSDHLMMRIKLKV